MLIRNGTNAPWTPTTEADRERVQHQLDAILISRHFRGSKRYPAMLRYVVEKTLQGGAQELKERTLGVEVFERRPDYDTNADPVVRFTASEVRKRLAQFYHECGEEPELQIELPLGSYIPEFNLRMNEVEVDASSLAHTPTTDFHQQALDPTNEAISAEIIVTPPPSNRQFLWAIFAVTTTVIFGLVFWAFHRNSAMNASKDLWGDFFHSSSPVILVVGSSSLELTTPEPPQTNLYDHMVGPYHHISVAAAIAISRLASVLNAHQVGNVVKEAPTTMLPDLRQRPVILVGALNNEWTLRLIEPLRFRFVHGPQARIEDRQNPAQRDWGINFDKPFSTVTTDYAIVARYHDHTTNGTLMIVAGLGPYGTEAASELVASPQYLKEISHQLPRDWASRNIELVIRTDVLDGQAGPPILVASTTW